MIGTLLLQEIVCYKCTVHFAMDQELYKRRVEDGNSFWCPNGHSQGFVESEITKLQKRLDSATKRLSWAESSATRAREEAETAKRQKTAIKGQLTKTRKRIANGICPCCKRTFVDLARHIDNKHPDFKAVVS